MTLQTIMTRYGVSRSVALTKLATVTPYNGRYNPLAVRRIFGPTPSASTETADKHHVTSAVAG